MKITKIETIRVKEMPRVLWVRMHTDTGLVGLGETWYGARAVSAIIHDIFSPFLVGRDPLDIELHWYRMFRIADYFGYGGAETRALSALDIALWDIAGQAAGQPIYKMLGGAVRDRIRIYNTCSSFGQIQDSKMFFEDPARLAKSLLAEGITAMKVYPFDYFAEATMGQHISPQDIQKGLEPIRKIRDAVGNAIEIAHDGSGRWNLPNAIRIAQAMEEYEIMWQEELLEPINAEAYKRLADATRTPVCAAERLISRWQFRDFIEKGAAEIAMPDLIWTGGISETRRIAAMAETYQVPVAPHDCTGPVNVFACAHICMNAPNVMIMETVRSFYKGWYGKYITPNLHIENGFLLAPEGPGLGTHLRDDVLARPDVTIETSDKEGVYPLTAMQPGKPYSLEDRPPL
jgi:L-alanine-DL-glutamate epimerase-like enolase superfamily enzyme